MKIGKLHLFKPLLCLFHHKERKKNRKDLQIFNCDLISTFPAQKCSHRVLICHSWQLSAPRRETSILIGLRLFLTAASRAPQAKERTQKTQTEENVLFLQRQQNILYAIWWVHSARRGKGQTIGGDVWEVFLDKSAYWSASWKRSRSQWTTQVEGKNPNPFQIWLTLRDCYLSICDDNTVRNRSNGPVLSRNWNIHLSLLDCWVSVTLTDYFTSYPASSSHKWDNFTSFVCRLDTVHQFPLWKQWICYRCNQPTHR